ncbi:protein N-lysine methyltransferase METTL21D-like isoform X2 [Adelges cooleyi]|uniref:protein N-lysine methyltransferase METTL21D-like isoform X2 n=1 Tax=Adelges cooleyi TaxID=133065 RepID=UPI00217F4220|nr:protein N-lysine methyltransferase METTL21D-like isoform X2 [Adelges cooleyi]
MAYQLFENFRLYYVIFLNMTCSLAFLRSFDLESINVTLKFEQNVGECEVNCVVWDAALVLAKYLEILYEKQNTIFASKRVLELGAGLGCVGITAACFGGDVILTDLSQNLQQLQCNIDENKLHIKGNAKADALKWGNKLQAEPFDILLMADCIYYIEVIEDLVKTMVDSTTPETLILISQEIRDTDKQKTSWEMFTNTLIKYFTISYIPEDEQHPIYRSSDILLINAKKKCL